jgi:hypothetical protein
MKSEKEKLAAKSVEQLKAAAKRLGGKLVTPDGKAKTKQQLINTIVMKQRLAGKSMGENTTTKKVAAKKTVAKKPTLGQKPFNDIPEFRVFIITKNKNVKITDLYYPDSKIIPYGFRGNATSTANEYLNSIGIKSIGRADGVLISKNFNTRIK